MAKIVKYLIAVNGDIVQNKIHHTLEEVHKEILHLVDVGFTPEQIDIIKGEDIYFDIVDGFVYFHTEHLKS